jgi:hypothetical protein
MLTKKSWPSATAVLFVILGSVNFYLESLRHIGVDWFPDESLLVLTIGVASTNLAYVLFLAGVFSGTFKVFGLWDRKIVLGLGVIAFVIGTYLSNSGLQW